ncbi:preprotein translocase subunit SecG [Fluviicola taffensis]|uniref:Protein-export membrane protein SecG n=1 Tax=Fluviicola taffensis (strain DSM 16823 / NCIMB 13979 / RW262) TaxID=755732 RepID=F2IBF8_FLUTR|nr:preprotein translocase subunit SecG [Fluviicola taffensis]AEA44266.1 preprotein translocase, SecG subunit [Fluviicola taffensis DSM 16823]
MIALISILLVLASVLLIVVVFVQNPKGGGLSSDFGAAQQIGGVQRTNDFIEKATWVLSAVILVGSIAMTTMMKPAKAKVDPKKEQQGPGGQQGGTAPAGGAQK